jgi:hypothetical protein
MHDLPADNSIVWTSSNTTIATVAGSISSAIVTKVGNGKITLFASINNVFTLPTPISVGSPLWLSIGSMSNLNNDGYTNNFQILSSSGNFPYEGVLSVDDQMGVATNYVWSYYSGVTGKNNAYWYSNGNTVDVSAKTSNAGVVIKCTSSNSCGSYSAYYTFYTGTLGGGGGVPLVISPNPAVSQVEISMPSDSIVNTLQASTNGSETATSYTVSLVDSYGSVVYSKVNKQKKCTLQTSAYRNGIYAVIVSDGINLYQEKLVIAH